MRAAVLSEISKPLTVRDVARPAPSPGQVLVRTHACGVCRTDLHIAAGLAYRPPLPHILGHEPAGVVAAVGAGVDDFAPGDAVAPYLFLYCGNCPACCAHAEAQCAAPEGILGVSINGAFADYFVIRAENLVRVPKTVSLDIAGLMGCAAITAVRALDRADLAAGQRAAVIGVGGIGMLIVQGLVAQGVEVEAASRSATGRDMALTNGAAGTIDPETSEGDGRFDRVFDLVGTAATMGLAGRLAGGGGMIVVVGEEPEFPAIETTVIAQRELDIRGTRNGARAQADEAMRLMAEGIFRPQVAARIALDDINDGFEAMERGAVHGRLVVGLV